MTESKSSISNPIKHNTKSCLISNHVTQFSRTSGGDPEEYKWNKDSIRTKIGNRTFGINNVLQNILEQEIK